MTGSWRRRLRPSNTLGNGRAEYWKETVTKGTNIAHHVVIYGTRGAEKANDIEPDSKAIGTFSRYGRLKEFDLMGLHN